MSDLFSVFVSDSFGGSYRFGQRFSFARISMAIAPCALSDVYLLMFIYLFSPAGCAT